MNQPASSDPLLTGLLARIASHRPGADGQLITRAYQAAAHWHQGQTRMSGDAYLTHPVAVAAILAELDPDDQMLCAALLHDTVQYSGYTRAAMRQDFGAVGRKGLERLVALIEGRSTRRRVTLIEPELVVRASSGRRRRRSSPHGRRGSPSARR